MLASCVELNVYHSACCSLKEKQHWGHDRSSQARPPTPHYLAVVDLWVLNKMERASVQSG